MKAAKIAGLMVLAVLTGVMLYGLFFVSEETRIARAVEKGRRAFVEERLLTMAGLISSRYEDRYGYDKATLIQAMRVFFREHGDIRAEIDRMGIEVTGETEAVVELQIRFSGDLDSESFHGVGLARPEGVGVRISMDKQGRSWKVVRFELARLIAE